MKRHGNLFEKITNIDNIKLAHKNASKGKSRYDEVIMVNRDIDWYCTEIQRLLASKEFTTSEYITFKRMDKGKERTMYKLPYFPDRIIQHAILQILEPIWKRSLIADTYQSIKGRGLHKCISKVKKAVRTNDIRYYTQLDVSKFYPSIDNEVLKRTIRRKVKCKGTLWLLDDIVDSTVGVPIGNYISQYFGNLYLSDIDHKLKEIYGASHYYRYCDDIVILDSSKEVLHPLVEVVRNELANIGLQLKPSYKVCKITERTGLDFLGYVVYSNRVLIRNRIKVGAKLATTDERICSYTGWLTHCDGYNLTGKLIEGLK